MQGFLKSSEKPRHHRAAELLEEFSRNFSRDKVSLQELLDMLGRRAFGIAIFVMALANILLAHLPGISTILGAPIVLLTVQMMMGAHHPWLPRFLAAKEFDRTAFDKMITRAVSVLRKVEVFIRPRLLFLVVKNDRLLGALCFIFAVVLALPILFGNWLPAWALAFIALGMIERDGLLILIGMVLGIASIFYAFAFFAGLTHLIHMVFQ